MILKLLVYPIWLIYCTIYRRNKNIKPKGNDYIYVDDEKYIKRARIAGEKIAKLKEENRISQLSDEEREREIKERQEKIKELKRIVYPRNPL